MIIEFQYKSAIWSHVRDRGNQLRVLKWLFYLEEGGVWLDKKCIKLISLVLVEVCDVDLNLIEL